MATSADGLRLDEGQSQKLTSWKNEPTLQQLKTDFENAKQSHGIQMAKIRLDICRVGSFFHDVSFWD